MIVHLLEQAANQRPGVLGVEHIVPIHGTWAPWWINLLYALTLRLFVAHAEISLNRTRRGYA
jgi:hypothetical protein